MEIVSLETPEGKNWESTKEIRVSMASRALQKMLSNGVVGARCINSDYIEILNRLPERPAKLSQ